MLIKSCKLLIITAISNEKPNELAIYVKLCDWNGTLNLNHLVRKQTKFEPSWQSVDSL